MIRKDLLIHNIRMLLGEFLAAMLDDVHKPRQHFLQQVSRPTDRGREDR